MRVLLAVLLSLSVFNCHSQDIPKKFVDTKWSHFNANINMFLSTGIGSAAKGLIDADYVDEKLSVKSYPFHNLDGFLIESYSIVNFEHEANKPHYNMKFGNGSEATFMESIHYLADNYSQYYAGPDLKYFYEKKTADSVKEKHQLLDSKRIMFHDYWYFDKDSQRLVSILRGIGLIAKNEAGSDYVAWIDMRYFPSEVLFRVKVITPEGNKVAFDDYLKNRPFVYESMDYGYSRYFDQKKYDPYNTEMYAYFELAFLRNQLELDRPKLKIKKGRAKSKQIQGDWTDGKLNGMWKCYHKNGKLKSTFMFQDGVANGEYSLYDLEGVLYEKGVLRNNVKEGEILNYFNTGSIKSKKYYSMGTPVKRHTLYFESGDQHSSFSFQNGDLNGTYIQYNENRTEYLRGDFKDGYIYEVWQFNVVLGTFLCDFIKDEMPKLEGLTGITPNCMDDCMATFKYRFTHKNEGHCLNGVCIQTHRVDDIQ